MYNKQEASAVRQKFWTRFGQYMSPVPFAGGEKLNWINYKTGVKGISFRMNADNNRAFVSIEITHGEGDVQLKMFHLFQSLQKPFAHIAGDGWYFKANAVNDAGKSISLISTELNNINIFRETDWPSIISFLKNAITTLDQFWSEYREVFEMSF